jgi:hypothetical protein
VYRFRKVLVIPVVLMLAAVFIVPRFFTKDDDRKLPEPATGVAISCPRVASDQLPAGMARVSSITRDLGDGVFGRSTIYSDGPREISFHIGYEIIEKLADLDFQQTRARIGSREVTLYEARALPGATVAAAWETNLGPPKCSQITVLTKDLGRAEFERLVAGLEIRPG